MRTLIFTAASFTLTALVACSAAPGGGATSSESTGTSQEALRKIDPGGPGGGIPIGPIWPPQPIPCTASRFDVHRFATACEMPAAIPGGTWTLEYLYPDAPSGVRERFCAYTWNPQGFTPGCVDAPTNNIPLSGSESLVARGYCPLSQPGCGPYETQNNLPAPPPVETTTCSGGFCTVTQPSTGVGCCDACAEVHGARAYAVIPQNVPVLSAFFDIDSASGPQHVVFYNPTSNIVAVDLDPNIAYTPELVAQVHYTTQ